MEYLVENKTNINKENKYGRTPLFNACERGNKDLVEYLVEHGADINKRVHMEEHLYLMHVEVEMKI